MIKLFKSGNLDEALKIHLNLYPLFRKLFMAPNPVPVKEALKYYNIINEYVRSPLVVLDEQEKQDLISVLKNYEYSLK